MEINQEQYKALIKAIEDKQFSLGKSINAAKSSNDLLKENKLVNDILALLEILRIKKDKLDE